MQSDHERILLDLAADPVLAHEVLFAHRHPLPTPQAHRDVIRIFHSAAPRVLLMAFRDFAKSTITEETVIVQALLGQVRNVLVLGESEQRACDRLRAVKHELEYNELLRELFGDAVGPTWGETRIVLTNGCCVQAYGRGQSLRGVKHLQWRPDFVVLDDVEDEQAVATREARAAVLRWWTATVLPAMAVGGRVRMLATPIADGPEPSDKCLPLRLADTPEWETIVHPVKFLSSVTGLWEPTWPEKHDLSSVGRLEAELTAAGRPNDFAREYMCRAVADEARPFPASIIPPPSPPRAPGWRPVFAAVDPARTVRASSDYTGWAVWSWDGPSLHVWESGAERLPPNAIIEKCRELNERYRLAALGVEQDGLNEFILQPLRLASSERGTLPLVALKAPAGKRDFISALEPFFRAGDVDLVGPSHDKLRDQLLAFPTGHDDAPNALAYALPMRGTPRYPHFSSRCVLPEGRERHGSGDCFVVVDAVDSFLVCVLVRVRLGHILILADAIEEGDPRSLLPAVVAQMTLLAGQACDVGAPPARFERTDATGLRFAASRVPTRLIRFGDPAKGREALTRLMRIDADSRPLLQVSERARWTLRALAGGVGAQKSLFAPLEALCGALESLLALYQAPGGALDDDNARRYSVSTTGRRYLSAAPDAAERR